jgi:hypothetical protein
MSNANLGYEYFEEEAEPLPFFLQTHSPRKPSFDDLIDSLFPASPVPTAASPSPKPRKSPAAAAAPAAARKERRPKDNCKTEGVQRGHWCGEENRRYHWFLELHFGHFLNKQMRRMDKIFKTMEKFMVTREAEQCRSHHQKMEKKHGSFANILTELRNAHYHSTHPQPVEEDMRAHGVQCGELMSWGQLQGATEWESERSTSLEVSPVPEMVTGCHFVDPLAEMNEDGQLFLE